MRPLAIILISLLIFCQCKREEEILNGYVAGRLMYQNQYETNPVWKPVAKAIVKISTIPSDTLNYITTVTTDSAGYFVFGNLESKKKYLIFFSDSIDHILYSGARDTKTTIDSFLLKAQLNTKTQNGFRLTIADAAGEPPAKGKICVFRNATDWQTDTCENSLYSLSVDEKGVVNAFNIAPGDYYFIGSGMIGGRYSKGKTFVNVGASQVAPGSITLVPVPSTGFELTIFDSIYRPMPKSEICVFRSSFQLFLDKCDNNSFTLTTDSIGKAKKINLDPGKYYLRVSGPSGTNLKKLDSVEVIKNQVKPHDVRLVSAPSTGFELSIFDPFDKPLPGTEICVFRSSFQLFLDKCDNNVFKLTSDSEGKAKRVELDPGKYYLRISGPSGTNLKKLDSVEVTSNEIRLQPIYLR